jgi:hypothetical protein
MAWWLCPNSPRCPHGSVLHDVYDYEDESPRCCVDGCGCGDAMVQVVKMTPVSVPYPIDAEHPPPVDFDD